MTSHRAAWKPIVVNIGICLIPVIGVLALLARVCYAACMSTEKFSMNSALFFARTHREIYRNSVEDEFRLLEQQLQSNMSNSNQEK